MGKNGALNWVGQLMRSGDLSKYRPLAGSWGTLPASFNYLGASRTAQSLAATSESPPDILFMCQEQILHGRTACSKMLFVLVLKVLMPEFINQHHWYHRGSGDGCLTLFLAAGGQCQDSGDFRCCPTVAFSLCICRTPCFHRPWWQWFGHGP